MEFIQDFLQDEFLSKTVILTAVTGILLSLRNIPKFLWVRLTRLIVFSVTIEQTDELFDYVERWLRDNYSKKYRSVLANINYTNFAIDEYRGNIDTDNKEIVSYRHNSDVIIIKYNSILIRVSKGREKLENAKSLRGLYFDNYILSTVFFKRKMLELLDIIVEYNQKFKRDENIVNIKSYNGYDSWDDVKSLNPKKLKNIVLDDSLKNLIVSDVDRFIKSKDWYNERSIPYKRGYLFYGPPGNGKTSLALALAHYLNKDIYSLSISEVEDDRSLKRLFGHIKIDSILLLEDVDAIYVDRRGEKDNKVSFSALLNCLDGIFYKEGVITIMTTNYKDKLDKALIRAGRIDLKIEFNNPKQNEVKKYIELFYNIKFNGEVYNKDFAMSEIQNICLSNDDKSIKKELFN